MVVLMVVVVAYIDDCNSYCYDSGGGGEREVDGHSDVVVIAHLMKLLQLHVHGCSPR